MSELLDKIKSISDYLPDEEKNKLVLLTKKALAKKYQQDDMFYGLKDGEEYFYIDGSISNHEQASPIKQRFWHDGFADQSNASIGNCFKTIQKAVAAFEYLAVYNELKNFSDINRLDWNDCENTAKYYIYYDYEERSLRVTYTYECRDAFQIYFSSQEVAETAIELVGKKRIEYRLFGIED